MILSVMLFVIAMMCVIASLTEYNAKKGKQILFTLTSAGIFLFFSISNFIS